MSVEAPADIAKQVARALDLADSRPVLAARLATQALASARRLPPVLRVNARLALGRAAWARRDVAAAVRVLKEAPRSADRHGLTEVAAVHPGARQLEGQEATVAAVLAALDGARLAHLAAHGSFRADNPQLSSLRLADGPLTVYDLETLPRPPRTLMLPACDTGPSQVRPGEEIQGLAAALLSLGADAVVASVAPVADDLGPAFAVDLHRELAAGRAPGDALAAARARWLSRGSPGGRHSGVVRVLRRGRLADRAGQGSGRPGGVRRRRHPLPGGAGQELEDAAALEDTGRIRLRSGGR